MTSETSSALNMLQDTGGISDTYGDFIYDTAQRYLFAKRRHHIDLLRNQPYPFNDTVEGKDIDIKSMLPGVPRIESIKASFAPLQEWEGYVVEIGDETFVARLIDLTSEAKQEEEEVDFPISELSETDKQRLRPGAIFRWAIGYRKTSSGSKERVSCIVFRRLPAWSDRELKDNRRKAKLLAAALQGE
jgi:hypothetical protein